MKALRRLFSWGSPGGQPNDWGEIENYFQRLRAWGFDDETGTGYRRRLKRLCRFLLDLGPKRDSRWPKRSDFEKLECALKDGCSAAALPDSRQRLAELRTVLADLQRREKESEADYLARLQRGLESLHQRTEKTPQDHAGRQQRVTRALRKLGVHAAGGADGDGYPPACLGKLRDLLFDRLSGPCDVERLERAKARWRECFEDCTADWEWAYLQVLIRLGEEHLKDENAAGSNLEEAQGLLKEAIRRLERGDYLQAREQGLYGILAKSYLARAKALPSDGSQRVRLLREGLAYAMRAVEMEPESVGERLGLIQILSALQDYEEMKAEAEIALNLDSGSETLRTVGASFWDRTKSLRKSERRKVLREAATFFANALRQVESASFNEAKPLEQAEAHGWAHFWLGRFLSERGLHDEAATHLRTACSLGFKPLEAKVELAWTYYLGRDLKRADHAFREAIDEAGRQRSAGTPVAKATAEERTIDELEFDTYLGWAFLTVERGLDQVEVKLHHALERLTLIHCPHNDDLKAAIIEVRGRMHLGKKELDKAIKAFEIAIAKSPRSGAYCGLGFARLTEARQVKDDKQAASEALRRARETHRLAKDTDVRERHRRELWLLRQELQKETAEENAPASST